MGLFGKKTVKEPEKRGMAENISKAASYTSEKVKDAAEKSNEAVTDALDEYGDGTIDIKDVIVFGLRIPGVKIDRREFLQDEFEKRYPAKTVTKAIEKTPARAKIHSECIDKLADGVIQSERFKASGVSAALAVPGGAALIATIPADIIQYFGYMLRAAQKLMYLYGFPQIDVEERGDTFEQSTINLLSLCLGVMYGVPEANEALRETADTLSKGASKRIMKRVLTKSALNPILKQIAKWFGVNMTRQTFEGFFKSTIPVVGSLAGGAITYVTFRPCCDKLQQALRGTKLAGRHTDRHAYQHGDKK